MKVTADEGTPPTMKLTCECLNVKIHVKTSDLVPIDLGTLGLNEELHQELNNTSLAETQLDLEGISQEHAYLQKSTQYGSWQVFRCVNCSVLTHVMNTEARSNRLLVNTNLLSHSTVYERLSQSADYSPLYKIVLQSRNDNHPLRSQGLQSGQYESLQSTLTSIQQKLNQYLISEESQMEERIRRFEEQQRSEYAALQSKARRDKNDMISLVLSTEQQQVKKSLSEAIDDEKPKLAKNQLDQKSNQSLPKSMSVQQGQFIPASINKRPNNQNSNQELKKQGSADSDHDGVFDLDGFEDEDQSNPFYESDDADEDTDNSYTEPSPMAGRRPPSTTSPFSTSVPISMMAPRKSWDKGPEEGNLSPAPDLEHMAASIQALAQSVHEDGTEMFGGLPRPRMNTWGDKVRPNIRR